MSWLHVPARSPQTLHGYQGSETLIPTSSSGKACSPRVTTAGLLLELELPSLPRTVPARRALAPLPHRWPSQVVMLTCCCTHLTPTGPWRPGLPSRRAHVPAGGPRGQRAALRHPRGCWSRGGLPRLRGWNCTATLSRNSKSSLTQTFSSSQRRESRTILNSLSVSNKPISPPRRVSLPKAASHF